MKKFGPTKDRTKDINKNDLFQKYEDQIQNFSTTMNHQQTQSALTTPKIIAACFKDVKIEETFSSQDQKLVETTNL